MSKDKNKDVWALPRKALIDVASDPEKRAALNKQGADQYDQSQRDPWEKDPWETEPTPGPAPTAPDENSSEERPWYDISGKGLLKSVAEQAPTAGMIAGGVAGSVEPGGGSVLGAGLGYGAGKGVQNFIEQHLLSEPKTESQVLTEPFKAIPEGMAYEMGGQALTKGVGDLFKASRPEAKSLVPKGLLESTQEAQKYEPTTNLFEPRPKPNAEQIQSSAKNLGFNATPGMLSSNPNIHDLESTLGNSPTLAGEKVRQSYDPVYKGMNGAANTIVGGELTTPVDAGMRVKQGLMSKIENASAPLEDSFQNIRESTTNINPDPVSLKRAAQRLRAQPFAEFPQLPQGAAISKYADAIENAKSLDSLKQLRSSAGAQQTQAYRSGNAMEASAYGQVIDSIKRLERRQIIQAAAANMPTELQGQKAAQSLIGQIKATNKGWSALMDQLNEVARAGGINKQIKNPRQLIAMIENMSPEDVSKSFFDTGNYQGLQAVKKFAPEEFEPLRQAKLSDIANKSKTNGEINPKKLVANLQKIGPQARQILIGPKAEQTLQDLATVSNNIPGNINPSKTSKGNAWMQFVTNPARWSHWGSEAGAAYNYMLLQGKNVPQIRSIGGQVGNALSNPMVRAPVGMGAYGALKSGASAAGGFINPQQAEKDPWE